MQKAKRFAGAFVAATMGLTASALAATEIQWWHAMGGVNGERVNKIANDFNATQSDYKVVPVFKGNYTETMTAAIAAFRAKKQPHIVQVFEVGTATMMSAKGAVYPIEQMMSDAGEPFDKSTYLPAVISYYQTSEGQLLSMPFNSSTPVLWYNRDALKKAGVASAPTTWAEMKSASEKLVAAGYKCGFSFGWQSWVMIENYGAWHNIAMGTKENGFAGFDTEFTFNNDNVKKRLDEIASMVEGPSVRLWRPPGRQPADVHQWRMRHVDELLGLLRQHQEAGQVRIRPVHAAARHRWRQGAAELDHRRRHAVGPQGSRLEATTRASPSS